MIVNRNIGKVNVDIDINQAKDIYFDENVAQKIKSDNMSDILDVIYLENGEKHMPLSLFIELTNTCNFACPFCYIHEKKIIPQTLPNFFELKESIDYFIDKGLIYCTLSGGECLNYPDFKELYVYLKKNGVLTTVFTNGYLIDDSLIDLFKRYPPFKIEVSIYGYDDDSYQRVVKRHVEAQQIFSTILKLKYNGINVICKTPITNLTEDSYQIIETWCKDNNVLFYTGYELVDGYSGESKKEFLASDKVIQYEEEKNNLSFFNSQEMISLSFSECARKMSFDCTAGKTDIFVNYNLDLFPCMQASNIKEWKFNIKELGVDKAYGLLVDKIDTYKNEAIVGCEGCKHHKVCQECFFTLYEHESLNEERKKYCKKLSSFLGRKIQSI